MAYLGEVKNFITPVRDVRLMPEEEKNLYPAEPEIRNVALLGEYIYRNKETIPLDLLKLTEDKGNINELILKHVRLDNDSIKHLSVFLYFIKQIDLVDFTDMLLSPNDFLVLSPALYRLPNLLELHLNSNHIGSGTSYLSKSFSGMPKLAHLALIDCKMSSIHFLTLCQGLKSLKSLEILQVSLNPIGDDGCRGFCEILPELFSLISVEMFTCNITNKGGEYLIRELPNANIQNFLLGNNRFSPRFENKLKDKFAFVHVGVRHNMCALF